MRSFSRVIGVLSLLFLCLINANCNRKSQSVFLDTEMRDNNWVSHQAPEVNEWVASYDGRQNCRHVIDSIPSFGGIINAEDFPLKKGDEYVITFTIKVISGTVNIQIIQDFDKSPTYLSFGGIKDEKWTKKEIFFTAEKTSPKNRINFTNNMPTEGVEFYIDNVRLRER